MTAAALSLPDALHQLAGLDGFSSIMKSLSEGARALAAGALQDAYRKSGAAMAEGKALEEYAKRMRLGADALAKVRTMLAQALELESRTWIAIADEYDAAQAQGLVAGKGRPKKVHGVDVFRIEDFGLSKQQLSDARKLRDAEAKEPGLIRRLIDNRIAEGAAPSRHNLRAAIGTASATKDARGENFYQTPAVATLSLLALESFSETVWEPACGHGAISTILEDRGYDVILSDLVDRGTVSAAGRAQSVGDFLDSRPAAPGEGPDIVTNPPYGSALNGFVAHALRVHKPRKMALLLNLNFICGFADDDRSFVMDELPPARVYAFKRRLPMMHREGWDGDKASSRMNTAWFVWERQEDGSYGTETKLFRIDWADYAEGDALTPGEGGHGDIWFDDAPRTTPRKSLTERTDERRDEARGWILKQADFDRGELRRAIGIRDTTAEALISEFEGEGLIGAADADGRHHILWKGLQ